MLHIHFEAPPPPGPTPRRNSHFLLYQLTTPPLRMTFVKETMMVYHTDCDERNNLSKPQLHREDTSSSTHGDQAKAIKGTPNEQSPALSIAKEYKGHSFHCTAETSLQRAAHILRDVFLTHQEFTYDFSIYNILLSDTGTFLWIREQFEQDRTSYRGPAATLPGGRWPSDSIRKTVLSHGACADALAIMYIPIKLLIQRQHTP